MRISHILLLASAALYSHLAGAKPLDITQQGLQAPPLAMIEDARSQFHLGNQTEAAKDLGSAASLMRLEATTYSGLERTKVGEFASRLDRLGQDVKGATVKSPADFDALIRGITIDKAVFHALQAKKVWDDRDLQRSGYEILAAAHATEHALVWTGRELPTNSGQVLAKAKDLATQLIDRKDPPSGAVERLLKELNKQIDQASQTGKPSG